MDQTLRFYNMSGLLTCMFPKDCLLLRVTAAPPSAPQSGILVDTECVLTELKSNELKIALMFFFFRK